MHAFLLLLLGAHAAEPPPFAWSVRMDGRDVATGDLATGLTGWSCSVALDDPQGTQQFGSLACEGPKGEAVETLVMCATGPGKPTDSGSGSLVVTQGGRDVALELTCRSPGSTERPRLHLEPDLPSGTYDGVPAHRDPPKPGAYRWQVEVGDRSQALVAPGPVAAGAAGWRCTQEVSGVTDPTYGYAEYATLACEAEGTRFTTLVACARLPSESHACQAGSLRVAPPRGGVVGMMLLCEDVGNPGCFQ